MKRSTTLFVATVAMLAVGLAGCGGSSGSSSGGSAGQSSYGGRYGGNSNGGMAKATTRGATIAAASSDLGRILVDGQGRTVYLFEKDMGTTSSCYGPCASVWPPLTTSSAPKAGNGTVASKLATSKRSNGALQVTYSGHPLYTYADDAKPGQTNGEGVDGFGAEWYAVSPTGKTVENQGS
jgi:predicted lipoprotein with Yx(FWY)xxD motif